MNQNNQSRGIELIQKKIGLLYIIFIVMAFLYIPADFVDIFKDINVYYEESVYENEKLYDYNYRIINYFTNRDTVFDQSIPHYYQGVKFSSDKIIQEIERYKTDLIEQSGGLTNTGYITRGKNYELSKNYLIRGRIADTISQLLEGHKSLLKEVAHSSMINAMDSILYLGTMVGSSGETKKFSEYYFDQVPVSAAISFLSKLQNDLKRLDNFVIESHYKSLMSLNDNLDFGVSQKIKEVDSKEYEVAVSKLGQEIVFALEVISDGKLSFPEYFVDGMLNSIPSSSMILNQRILGIKDLEVSDSKKSETPVIQSGYTPVLYTGINNLVRIKDIHYGNRQIFAELTSGEIIRKDSSFFIRVSKPGFTRLTVFGTEEDKEEKVLLSSQKFQIKDLPDPKAFIYNKQCGELSEKMFKVQKRLDVKNQVIDEAYMKVNGYEIKRINELVTETVYNKGAFFNAKTRELINKASSGDMYIFNEIVVEYSDGSLVNLDPVVLTII